MEPTKFNVTRLIITVLLVLLTAGAVGGGVWYFMDQNAKQIKTENEKEVTSLQKQVDELKGKTTNNAVKVDSKSSTKNGVTLKISPTSGAIGASVNIQITGLNNFEYTDLFLRTAGGWVPNAHQKVSNTNGTYTGTYVIPSTVLTAQAGAQNPNVEAQTDKGVGAIVLTSTTSPNEEITIPFTVQ